MDSNAISEMQNVYRQTFYRRYLFGPGERPLAVGENEPVAECLIPIEELAMRLRDGDYRPPFSIEINNEGNEVLVANPLGTCVQAINWNIFYSPGEHRFSPNVSTFLALYRDALAARVVFPERYDWYHSSGKELRYRVVDLYKDFLDQLRSRLDERDFKKSESASRNKMESLYKEACDYVDTLFKKEPELAVFGIDVCLDEGWDWPKNELTTEQWKARSARISKFLTKKSGPMKHLVGYLGRWDWTASKGFHVHFILFMEGKKIADDQGYARAIGDFWVDEISKSKGSYHLAEPPPEFGSTTLAVHINKSDRSKRALLRDLLVSYVAKSGFYYQHASLGMANKFIRGQMPEKAPRKKREKVLAVNPSPQEPVPVPVPARSRPVYFPVRKAKLFVGVKDQELAKTMDSNQEAKSEER
ncbi:MAG: hypothetical protein Q8J78_12305 [Moraxellaceae bacterium]|nr:hypothetical protein [Moraxellaceae bacterium]